MRARQLMIAVVMVGCGSHPAPQMMDATTGSPDGAGADSARVADASRPTSSIAASGTRLKLTWFDTSDGIHVPVQGAFYDNARGESCRSFLWTDGNTYCTPEFANADVAVEFTDGSCTMPIIDGVPDGGPVYAPAYGIGTVTKVAMLYTSGAPITKPAMVWSITDSEGTCSGPAAAGPIDSYHVAVAVPASSFVQITIPTPTGTDPLEPIYEEGADGLRWPLDIAYDTVASSSCTLPDGFSPDTACGLPSGVAFTSPTLTRAASSIPGARLEPVFLTAAPAFAHFEHVLHDPMLGADCAFGDGPGSSSWCQPYAPLGQTAYSEDTCTDLVDVIEVEPSGSPTLFAEAKSDYTVRRVGAQHAAILWVGTTGAECNPLDGPGGDTPVGYTFYDLSSTTITSADEVAATITIDP